MVEYQLPKLTAWVRFPSPRPTNFLWQGKTNCGVPGENKPQRAQAYALIAQQVERIHGKDEVIGSIPIEGSIVKI